MENEEENQQDLNSEENEEQVPSLLEVEERLSHNEGDGIFACPQCGTGVAANASNCSNCGAQFEEVPMDASAEINEEHMPSVADLGEEPITGSEPENNVMAPSESALGPQSTQTRDPAMDRKFKGAISDYYEKRKKRYLFGALSLGLGIILFVTLWLVVVNSVLVSESANIFGIETIALLVVAGVFFILGLFLTLTYPSSSLSELLTSMPADN